MSVRHKKDKKWNKRLDTVSLIVGAFFAAVVILFIVVAVTKLQARQRNQTDHQQPLVITNMTYCNGEKLDLWVPQSKDPVPVVVYIHGGGWRYGSKVGGTLDMFTPLLDEGIAVASINYRLAATELFPAAAQDVQCAVRFLKTQAGLFHLDAQKVGLAGISAGAHLAALSANLPDETTFSSGEYAEVSNEVQATVLINGLYDLSDSQLTDETQENVELFLGEGVETLRKAASPINHLSSQSPSQLIIYSPGDKLVHPSQSLRYYEKAVVAGVNVQKQKVDRATHNLDTRWGVPLSPSNNEIKRTIADFFKEKLR